jgi:hypothetical protein
MLSGVLTSKRAVEVNVATMRTFVRLRQLLATHEDLAWRLDQLEWRQSEQDGRVQYVFETIQQLIEAPEPQPVIEPKRTIGFPTSRLVGPTERRRYWDEHDTSKSPGSVCTPTHAASCGSKGQIAVLTSARGIRPASAARPWFLQFTIAADTTARGLRGWTRRLNDAGNGHAPHEYVGAGT